ncbi:hypothetical protein [Shewanella woodyi]|uniref:hypothetical protein n=1 Tax=Shewanella woodyi TaxID=60961 RepID=UPI000ADFB022|nr:hypothetical protein [Shewanella woodyi]
MDSYRLVSFIKACLLTGVTVLSSSVFAADRSSAELVDAVNGTPDTASREAGKKVTKQLPKR